MKLAEVLRQLIQPWEDEDIELYATHLRALLSARGVEAAVDLGETEVDAEFVKLLRQQGYETPA